MRNSYWILFIFSFLLACGNKKALPKGILSHEKMESVMWDMMRTGQFLNGYVLSKNDSLDKVEESQRWYDKVYAMHNVSREEFEKSYAYYREHPPLMRAVMDSISKKPVPLEHAVPLLKDTITQNKDSLKGKKQKVLVVDTLMKKRKLGHQLKVE